MINRILIVLFLISNVNGAANSAKAWSVTGQAVMLTRTAEKYHYAPKPLDDDFSKQMLKSYLKLLDPNGKIFTLEQTRKLARFENDIDEQIRQRKTTMLDTVFALYSLQLQRIDVILEKIRKRGIDVAVKDAICLGGNTAYAPASQFEEEWTRWIKYMVLWSMHTDRDSTDSAGTADTATVNRLLGEVIDREQCKLQLRISTPGEVRTFVEKKYLEAIAGTFDPHTSYMSLADRVQFEDALSRYSGSFGIEIDINVAGEVEIVKVLPGGPAWRSNEINDGDILLGVTTSDKKTINFRCISLKMVIDELTALGGETVTFRIRKKSAKTVHVTLQKELLDVEENSIRSFVLKGEHSCGYIYLPSFYDDVTGAGFASHGCANDLAKELIKLKKDSIEGLVIDIRFNGGGSMHEALRMAGSFIDKGALCSTHSRGGKPQVIKDEARGTVYNGPLVVLVNAYSASASELFAGVLQDYNRAIIAGATTYGKATMQVLIPLDAGTFDSLALYEGDPQAFCKITRGGFYRVTGKSHQKKGVVPDIALPDLYQNIATREASNEGALSLSTIDKKVYSYPFSPLPVAQLNAKSAQRLEKNGRFDYVKREAPNVPEFNSRYTVPLEAKQFARYMNKIEGMDDSLKSDVCPFTVERPSYAREERVTSATEDEELAKLIKNVGDDIYIIESFNIVSDIASQGH